MSEGRRVSIALVVFLLVAPVLGGCSLSVSIGGEDGPEVGVGDVLQGAKAYQHWRAARTVLSPEARATLGRTSAARLVARHGLVDDPEAHDYLDRVGQSLVWVSKRPETWDDYHFLILDGDQPNAYACPGGLVLVTRGLLETLDDEDMLAAVLAHELAHLELEHAEQLIDKKQWKKFRSAALGALGASVGVDALATLLGTMTTDHVDALTVRGYGRDFELAADARAVELLVHSGYSPHALDRVLATLRRGDEGKGTFRRTHPDLNKRRRELRGPLADDGSEVPEVRRQRFAAAFAGLRSVEPADP